MPYQIEASTQPTTNSTSNNHTGLQSQALNHPHSLTNAARENVYVFSIQLIPIVGQFIDTLGKGICSEPDCASATHVALSRSPH